MFIFSDGPDAAHKMAVASAPPSTLLLLLFGFAFDVRLIDLAFCDNRNAHRTGFRMFRLLEGSRHQRYVGAQFHIAGRRPGIPRMLRE